MKLVVGLGNPGSKYSGTRHNIGFEVLRELSEKHGSPRPKSKFNAELVELVIHNEKTILLSPLTFMNLSGQSVLPARDFYKIDLQDILVVCDDFQLPLGKLRFRPHGSSGGQNGLNDVISRLGSDKISRLRFGIDAPQPGWKIADYVLSRFTEEDQTTVKPAVGKAAAGVEDWVQNGITYCMNQYNGQ